MVTKKQFDIKVNAKGLRCPMPLLKAKLALNSMLPDQTLLLLATDPTSERDIGAYCRQAGYQIVSVNKENNIFQYLITKTENRQRL